MRSYTISRIQGAPDWDAVPALQVDNHLWLPPLDIRMSTQICYDENGLYLRQRAWERNVRAEHDAPLSMVCEDSCMEFFFRPDESDGRYFNFEVNPNGRMYIGLGHNRYDSVRLCPQNEDLLLQKRPVRLPDGWEIFYTIPLSFLQVFFPGYALTAGRTLYANCFKCGDLTVQPHYLSWNPVLSPTPDFHRSCDFGAMLLG